MAGQLNQLPTSLEPIARRGALELEVSSVWYKFFQSVASLYSGNNGSAASALLDTIGNQLGGMLARFGTGWHEFVASAPNQIPVMNPNAIVALRTIGQLLDTIGNAQGDVLFRGAAGWQVVNGAIQGDILFRGAAGWEILAPSLGGFLQSQGAGVDPAYVAGTTGNTVATNLVATGTTQGDALALVNNWNEIITTPANAGVKLGALGIGQPSLAFNQGVNSLKVYPPVGGVIDGLAANAPYALAATKAQQFSQLTGTRWRSLQLG